MYQFVYLNVKEMCAFLGLGRGKVLELCKNRTNGFPVVKVGNRYRSDQEKLAAWRDRWYDGEFEI